MQELWRYYLSVGGEIYTRILVVIVHRVTEGLIDNENRGF